MKAYCGGATLRADREQSRYKLCSEDVLNVVHEGKLEKTNKETGKKCVHKHAYVIILMQNMVRNPAGLHSSTL